MSRRLHVLLTRHRRLVAALLASAAVLLLASPGADEGATTPVLVARSALSGGDTVAAPGVTVVQMPSDLVPEGALAGPGQAVGRVLVADRARGSVLTTADLLSSPHAGRGLALTGVKLADPSLLTMLAVGQRVTVVVAAEEGQEPLVLARAAVIKAIPASRSDSGLSSAPEPVVVVSTDPSSAARIATHATGQGVGIVME